MDRVTIERGDNGEAVAATITDFKSNDVSTTEEIESAAEDYRPQLDLYAQALSRLQGLPLERIRLQILFTQPGRVVELSRGS